MSALPRPTCRPGPHRDLVDALHDLHHRAGWPSLRTLARETGVSHTTVSKAFSSPPLPAWGTLELLVEAMDGDTATFHDLWLAASTPADAARPRTRRGSPAARAELAAVRRHLETGTGLLLVTGEAGIGKTTLVTHRRADRRDASSPTGHCLPLSTEVPLMPSSTCCARRPRRRRRPLARGALGALPGLRARRAGAPAPRARVPGRPTPDRRLRAAAPVRRDGASSTRAGGDRHPGLLLEDLHWADSSTLDLLEHLLAHVPSARVVGTFRTADPDIPATTLDRLARLRLVAGPQCLNLAPLDVAATREQLSLALGRAPAPGLVDEIHGRTRGHPFFTAQLATAGPETLALGLSGMFDHRLRELGPDGWAVARALGVADRALLPADLAEATGLTLDRVLTVLHQLSDQWLLAPPDGSPTVGLRHPLIAEAIRRRLAPGEAGMQHRRVAAALAARADAEPGEIARHWHAAGDRQHEVLWRRAAAERAAARFATREALDHWSRVLELWPAVDVEALGMSFAQALCRAIDAANSEGDFETERRLVALAETVDGTPFERAALLTRAGDTQYMLGNEERGMALLDRALLLHSSLPPSPELVDCLSTHILFLNLQGRYDESDAAILRAFEALDAVGDDGGRSRILSWASGRALAEGDLELARTHSRTALEVSAASGDPFAQLVAAVTATNLMLDLGAPVSEIDATAAPALELVARWQITEYTSSLLLTIVGEAHLRAGRRGGRGRRGPGTSWARSTRPPTPSTPNAWSWPASADGSTKRGPDRRAGPGPAQPGRQLVESQSALAEVELWAGLPVAAAAAPRPDAGPSSCPPTTPSWPGGRRRRPGPTPPSRPVHRDASARSRSGGCAPSAPRPAADPFGPQAAGTSARGGAGGEAELARLEGTGRPRLGRRRRRVGPARPPPRAAYCRWRAARAALREGRGTLAHRLLTRAAGEATQHVPLSRRSRPPRRVAAADRPDRHPCPRRGLSRAARTGQGRWAADPPPCSSAPGT